MGLTKYFFIALLLFQSSCFAKTRAQHTACVKDSDCKLISTGSCCGADTAFNVEFADKYIKPTADICKTMNVLCSNLKAVCKNNKCISVEDK